MRGFLRATVIISGEGQFHRLCRLSRAFLPAESLRPYRSPHPTHVTRFDQRVIHSQFAQSPCLSECSDIHCKIIIWLPNGLISLPSELVVQLYENGVPSLISLLSHDSTFIADRNQSSERVECPLMDKIAKMCGNREVQCNDRQK